MSLTRRNPCIHEECNQQALHLHLLHHAGVISSNGVNGSQATEKDSGTGIQVLLIGLPFTSHGPVSQLHAMCEMWWTWGAQCTQHAVHLQGDFGLSLTQDGYLPAAFLVRSSSSMHLFLSLHVSACASRNRLLQHKHCAAASDPEPATT